MRYQWHFFTAALQLEGRSLVPFTASRRLCHPDTGHKFLKINISGGVNLAGNLDGKSLERSRAFA